MKRASESHIEVMWGRVVLCSQPLPRIQKGEVFNHHFFFFSQGLVKFNMIREKVPSVGTLQEDAIQVRDSGKARH